MRGDKKGARHEQIQAIETRGQFLSKQSPTLARKQLEITQTQQRAEFEEIKTINNPVLKQKLLDSFADDCDSKAVHLKAANLPRQASHFILLTWRPLISDHILNSRFASGLPWDAESLSLLNLLPNLAINFLCLLNLFFFFIFISYTFYIIPYRETLKRYTHHICR